MWVFMFKLQLFLLKNSIFLIHSETKYSPLHGEGEEVCSLYPNILDIEYRNQFWQIFKTYDSNNTREATYHLYGAYLGNQLLSITLIQRTRIKIIGLS